MGMKLLDLYKSIMKTAGLHVTEDNLVSVMLDGVYFPVSVKGQRLALPSQAILARADKSDIMVFHPLNEQVTRGESEVLEKLRKLLMIRFNEVASTVMLKLLNISMSVGEQHMLTPDQSEFLVKVKGVDPKMVKTFEKIIEAMPMDQITRRIITLFLKKTGSVAGKRYKRVGVVNFPLYEDLKKAEDSVYGVKFRVKDKETLIALLEYVFPNIEETGSYNRGSDSDVAANLDALMQSSLAIIQALNSVTETFENVFNKNEDANELFIECDWQDSFMNLGALINEIRLVPMQAGNEGATEEANRVQAQQGMAATATYPIDQQMPTPASAVVVHPGHPGTPSHVVTAQTPAPAPQAQQKSGVAVDAPLEGFLAQRDAERVQRQQLERGWAAVTHQHPAQPQAMQPPYNPATPFMHGQPAPYIPPPAPVHTGRGLDFGSILAGNPGVAYATGGPVYAGGYQQQQPQQQTSRWGSNWNQPQGYGGGYQGGAPVGYGAPQQQQAYGYQGGYQRSL